MRAERHGLYRVRTRLSSGFADRSRRYAVNKPVIITTNKPFAEWGETFPNATCVVTLVDRLVHRSEIVVVAGKSFRLKESKEQSEERRKARETSKP